MDPDTSNIPTKEPSSPSSDIEMLEEPPIHASVDNHLPELNSQLNGDVIEVEEQLDVPLISFVETTMPKKSTKKRKTDKNAISSFSQLDLGASSIPSPGSSIVTLPSTTPTRTKSIANASSAAASKEKERSLTYVSYLNAYANSLTIHPPLRLPRQKDEFPTLCASSLDFEVGGLRGGRMTAYLPDVDQDRCGHVESFCPFSKRDGYSYCEKHLLDDKGLPFVPCAFQRLESNPCPYPARMPPGAGGKNRPQRSKEALCSLHMEKCMQEVRQHMESSANAIFSTMNGLAAYNSNVDKGLPPTNTTVMADDLAEPQTRDYLETYLRATAKDTYATGSSSENSLVDENDLGLFRSKTFDTDDELDSEEDDPLKYGHHFTIEELTRILRSKMAKQKELLACELRLQEYKLKDARARYLTDVMDERSFLPSVHTQAKLDPESCSAYRNIRTMLRVDKKRPRFSYANTRKPCTIGKHGGKMPESVSRCVHGEAGLNGKLSKCKQYSLPFSRHCLSHILEDQYQYLYKRCAAMPSGPCNNPVLRNMGSKYCYQHTDLNSTRSGPDLNLNDSHTQGSSSPETETDFPVKLPESTQTKIKKGVKNMKLSSRPRIMKVVTPIGSPKRAVKHETDVAATTPGVVNDGKSTDVMVIDETQPEPRHSI